MVLRSLDDSFVHNRFVLRSSICDSRGGVDCSRGGFRSPCARLLKRASARKCVRVTGTRKQRNTHKQAREAAMGFLGKRCPQGYSVGYFSTALPLYLLPIPLHQGSDEDVISTLTKSINQSINQLDQSEVLCTSPSKSSVRHYTATSHRPCSQRSTTADAR